jgi:hypothetical protein
MMCDERVEVRSLYGLVRPCLFCLAVLSLLSELGSSDIEGGHCLFYSTAVSFI